MPVRRTREFYGENPQRSQLSASGSLPIKPIVPPNRQEVLGEPRFVTALPQQYPFISKLSESPRLGYSWEITSLYLPVALGIRISSAAEIGKIKSISSSLAVFIGSQFIFSLSKTDSVFFEKIEKLSQRGYVNTKFSESPPVPVSIPGGQTINYLLSITQVETEEKSPPLGYEGYYIVGGSWRIPANYEELENFIHIPENSYMNYKFV